MVTHKERFIARSQVDELKQNSKDDNTSNLPITMQNIVDAVLFPSKEHSKQTRRLSKEDIRIARLYRYAISQLSLYSSGAQALASSDNQMFSRVNDAFTLKIKPDADGSNQAFVSIKLSDNFSEIQGASKSTSNDVKSRVLYLHCELDDTFEVLLFEPNANDRFQLLLDKSSEAFKVLVDSRTTLHIGLEDDAEP